MMRYIVQRPVKVGDRTLQPGDELPEAAGWRNLKAYEAAGYIVSVPESGVQGERLETLERRLAALEARLDGVVIEEAGEDGSRPDGDQVAGLPDQPPAEGDTSDSADQTPEDDGGNEPDGLTLDTTSGTPGAPGTGETGEVTDPKTPPKEGEEGLDSSRSGSANHAPIDFTDFTRADLNQLAAKAGIADSEKLPNRGAVIDALRSTVDDETLARLVSEDGAA